MSSFMTITVRTRFVGIHRWPEAPEEHAYLRSAHRHEFHVAMTVLVQHGGREIEFCQLKEELDRYVSNTYQYNYLTKTVMNLSCEQIAEEIGTTFRNRLYPVLSVTVSEDGENDGTVHYILLPSKINEPPVEKTPEPPIPLTEEKPRCFFGLEAEGPEVGKPTLFVPGSATKRQVVDALAAITKTRYELGVNIYFGAKNDNCKHSEEMFDYLNEISTDHRGEIFIEFSGEHDVSTVDECEQFVIPIILLSVPTNTGTSPGDLKLEEYIKVFQKNNLLKRKNKTIYKFVFSDEIIWVVGMLWTSSNNLRFYRTPTDSFFFKLDQPIS